MSNSFIKRRYNKFLSPRNNYFKDGGNFLVNFDKFISGSPDKNGKLTTGMFKGMSSGTANMIGGAANVAGGIVGSTLSNGKTSGVGNALSTASSFASNFGPVGGLAGGVLNTIGGIANAFGGSKLNYENIAKIQGQINNLNNFQSNASSFDTLADQWGNTALSLNFSRKDIGSGPKARKLYKSLVTDARLAAAFAENSMQNSADNLSEDTMNKLQKQYYSPTGTGTSASAAYGGFLNKYDFGGSLNTNGGSFPTGLTFINEGGTHESNPNEGVPMGIGENGMPNLVEQGEAIYKDYVFSNRLTVPKKLRSKYQLRGKKGLTFANAVEQIAKNFEERPNDPITRETLDEIMGEFTTNQELVRQKKEAKQQSQQPEITPKDLQTAEGIQNTLDAQAMQSMGNTESMGEMQPGQEQVPQEEQEGQYAHGGRLGNLYDGIGSTPNLLSTWNPSPYGIEKNYSYNKVIPDFISFKSKDNPTYIKSPIKDPAIVDYTQKFKDATEDIKPTLSNNRLDTSYSDYLMSSLKKAANYDNTFSNKNLDLGTADERLRYAPLLGFAISSATDALGLTNKPDYAEAGIIEGATKGGAYMPVSWNRIGNQLTYKAYDRDHWINKYNASAAASRRALMNQSGGNSGRAIAGLLAADYNAQSKLGDLYTNAEEYNWKRRQEVEDFNRATNQANSTGMLQADQANQSAYNSGRESTLRGALALAEMRNKERLRSEEAKSANLSGLFQTLGDIGFENKNMNMIRRLAETGALGGISEGHPLWYYLATEGKKSLSKNRKSKS